MSEKEFYENSKIPRYPNTGFQKALNLFSILALVLAFLYPLLKWDQIPDTIITHWGFSGQPDGWGPKGTIWIIPAVSLLLYLPLTILERFPSVWNVPVRTTQRDQKWVYQNIKTMLILMKFLMTAEFAVITYHSVQEKNLSTLHTVLFLVFLFGSMIFFIIRSIRKPPENYR